MSLLPHVQHVESAEIHEASGDRRKKARALWLWRISRLGLTALAVAATATSVSAQANDSAYPTRPVRMIVSYAAGNVTDTLARVIGEKLSAKWGQPVTIDNKPGQGGSLGARTAVAAPADGYTLLFSALAAMAINPHIYPQVGYDVLKDFAPVVRVAYAADTIVAINPALNITSLNELITYSKSHPTSINYGTVGSGTVAHINIEQLKSRTGLIAQHVPYKAATAVLTDLIGGRIQIQMEGSGILMPQVKAKKVIPIAVFPSKNPEIPEVPVLTELYPGYRPVVPWLGIFAPANTPLSVLDRINQDVREVLAQSDIKRKLNEYGLSVAPSTRSEFEVQVKADYSRLKDILHSMNVKVD